MRQVHQSDHFVQQLAAVAHSDQKEKALIGLVWALGSNPAAFPFIPGSNTIQYAKTEPLVDGQNNTAILRVWFRAEVNHVHLLMIEEMPE